MKMYWTTFKTCDSSKHINLFYVVAVDNLIYSIGKDFCGNEPIDIHILNTNTLIWSLLPDRNGDDGKTLKPPDVPIKRFGHTVVAYNKKIYLWGGENGEEMCDTLYCFDTKTLKWSRPQVTGIKPRPRRDHSACISNHLMYLFGGFDWDTKQNLNDVWCLDLKTMNWSNIITTGEIPSPRVFHAATVVNNRMYIHGGSHGVECTDFIDFMYLDLESNQWHRPETTGNISVSNNYDRSLFVHNDIIYVFGSCTGRNNRKFNDLYYLDTKRNHWNFINPSGKSPKERFDQACIVIGDKMFLLHETGPSHFVYRNKINVLDFNPSLKTLAIISIIENGLDSSYLPKKLRSEIHSLRQHWRQRRN